VGAVVVERESSKAGEAWRLHWMGAARAFAVDRRGLPGSEDMGVNEKEIARMERRRRAVGPGEGKLKGYS
jgi:hypothetical protein